MKNMKVNILGTEYSIETHKVSEDEYMQKNRLGMDEKSQKKYWRKVCRHEIIHAFFNESGLSDSSNCYDGAWAKNEEMVDWFAIQSPKIFAAYQSLEILGE